MIAIRTATLRAAWWSFLMCSKIPNIDWFLHWKFPTLTRLKKNPSAMHHVREFSQVRRCRNLEPVFENFSHLAAQKVLQLKLCVCPTKRYQETQNWRQKDHPDQHMDGDCSSVTRQESHFYLETFVHLVLHWRIIFHLSHCVTIGSGKFGGGLVGSLILPPTTVMIGVWL